MAKQPTLVTEEDRNMLGKAMRSLDKSLLEDKEAVRKPFWVMAATWNLAPANDGLFKGKERPAKDKLDSAWRQVEEHAALLRSNPLWSPLWRQVQQAGEVKDQWQLRARASLQKGWKNHVEGNPAWEELWAYTEQKSSSARACLSAALADQMEREGIKDTRTAAAVDALREFSRTAAGYSRRPKEPLPPALGKETNATLNLHPGYGPHRGAVREEGDGRLIKEEVREGGERVVEAFSPWFWSGMVQESLQEKPKGEREGPKAELQALITDGLQKFTDQWEKGPSSDLMGGLSEATLWYGLLHRRPSEFVEWVDRAKKGAEWYGTMAGRAYELVGLARKANRLEPLEPLYSAHDIGLLKDFGDTLRTHAERLARTMTPGNRPDAEPYATPLDARAANLKLAGQLNAWRDSGMGQHLLHNPLRPRSEAVVELIDAVNGQLPFVVRDGVSDYDQWEASYRVLRVAKAAQGVLDEAAYEAAWGTPRKPSSENDKEWLRKVVATATKNAARLNQAPASRSVLPEKPKASRTTGKPAVQTPNSSAIAKPTAGARKGEVAPGVVPEAQNQPWVQEAPQKQRTSQKQGSSQQQHPLRSQQQPWQRPVRRVRPPSQGQQPPRARIPGYGPYKGAARNRAEAQETLKETEKASLHVDGLMDTWFVSDTAKKPEKAEYSACEALRKACLKRPSADRRQGFREAAGVYGQIAYRAHQLGERLRRANLASPGTYSQNDIKALDDLADASFHHAARLARTKPPGNNPDVRAYDSPYMRKKGETEMEKRWADFKNTVWGKWLLSADPQEPLVKQLESVWALRKQHPNDDWTFAGRMGEVARAGNQLQKEYSEVASHYPHIAEGMEKLRYFTEGADKFAARLAQGDLPASLIPVNPRESREKSRTESQPAATSAPQARQAARAVEPTTARPTPTHPARPAPPATTRSVAQGPRRAARV
ncbi:hypothetical protein [Streptomyces sp. NBC_01187]|uniref:hypothetical protein n=1 Tax=Streptomyces sp. NBC_01187 TaxID=2903766 RepID=UPI002F9180E9|nr:hypothetical protein OG220_40265 [Streptomyces sp. NBC_01187]WSS46981.1 hypothetical protein OG220_41360 [Streptomyces sp. NBC_01187]